MLAGVISFRGLLNSVLAGDGVEEIIEKFHNLVECSVERSNEGNPKKEPLYTAWDQHIRCTETL